MARRPAPGRSRHDRAVKSRADRLSKAGYKVRADIPGYRRPGTIRNGGGGNGRRPDIMATRGKVRKIEEVETKGSHHKDRGQRRVFRNYASRRKNTSFRTVKV